jgi:tetratricopeptide (TPR) repeat protein
LFVPVCQAIQHAHQKGIIHRDVKPSNVLVAPYDGKPVVKVIDFGVAKAVDQQLTEHTLFTRFGTVIGTLEYMSPEQAELNNRDIDTRSDVYSLGVLLYELLTGSPPLRREQMQGVSFLEVLHQIREAETPRPSDRLSTSATLPAVAASRGLEPAQLTKMVRGELDWIVLKALEKDRGRRYETASGLARDIERYLGDEPVEACPPSVRYRLSKLLWRHRRVLIPAAAFVALLVIAAAVSTLLAFWALQAEQKTRDALANEIVQRERAEKAEKETREEADTLRASFRFFQEDLLGLSESGDQESLRESNIKLRTVLDRAASNVTARFGKRPNEEARIRVMLGNAYRLLLEYAKAETHLTRALELLREQFGPEHPDTLAAMHYLARVYLDQGRAVDGEKLISQTLAVRRRVLGEKHRDTLRSLNNLAVARLKTGSEREDVLKLLLEGLETSREALGAEDPLTLQFQFNAATIYSGMAQWDKAESLYEKTLAAQRRVLGPDSPATCMTALQFGTLYVKQGQAVKAAPLLDQAVEGYMHLIETQEVQASNIQSIMAAGLLRATLDALANQGADLLDKKRYGEAVPLLQQYLDIWKKHSKALEDIRPHVWQPNHVRLLLGRCLAGQQKFEEAEPLLLDGLEETWRQADRGKLKLPASPFSRDFELEAVRNQVMAFYKGRPTPEKAAALLEQTRQPK